MKKPASEIRVGDVVMPPAREVSLWMRRRCVERGLDETALHLTVRSIHWGSPDKGGSWLVFRCDESAAWTGPHRPMPFTFKARPDTPWVVIAETEANLSSGATR